MSLGKTLEQKNLFNSGIARKGGRGFTLARIFWTPFFDQLIVPKKVIFYPKLTIFVGFFSIFCHHYHQNDQNFDQNYQNELKPLFSIDVFPKCTQCVLHMLINIL